MAADPGQTGPFGGAVGGGSKNLHKNGGNSMEINMRSQIGKNIRALRARRLVSQEDLAEATGVTAQAVSKWETGAANPDLMLLPKLAEYFDVTIDSLFHIRESDNMLPEDSASVLRQHADWWAGIEETDLTTVALPRYGFFTPTEDTLCLLGDMRGKNVLEIACGSGDSLVWMGKKGARELWGLDISSAQIKRADAVLKKNGMNANLFVAPMELNPGLPHGHFDLVFSIYGLGWSMDLEKTVCHIAQYLRPGGKLVFSWDNPLMQCVISENGKYSFCRSYLEEEQIPISKHNDIFHLNNWKLSTYLNCLARHGFLVEQLVEESEYDEKEAAVFEEGRLYSAGRARFFNPAFIVKARRI